MYRCQICFDELGTNGHIACTPCGHAFCSTCLSHALNHAPLCPSCRSPVETKHGTLPALDARELITQLCQKWPGRRAEIEALGPRVVRVFVDKDVQEQAGEVEDGDEREWLRRRVAELETRLGEKERVVELMKVEEKEEVKLMRAQLKGLEKSTKEAVDRACQAELELGQREENWGRFFEMVSRERVALEDALAQKDQEMKKAKASEGKWEKEVSELRGRIKDMDKREQEQLRRIGDAAHALRKKDKRITRYKAALQLSKEKEASLQAQIEKLKAAASSSAQQAKRKPLEPLSPNSQRSDPALPLFAAESDEEDAPGVSVIDNSLEVVSMWDENELDPSMDLLAGPRARIAGSTSRGLARTGSLNDWIGAPTFPIKRQKIEKKELLKKKTTGDAALLFDKSGGLKKNVISGMGHRIRAKT